MELEVGDGPIYRKVNEAEHFCRTKPCLCLVKKYHIGKGIGIWYPYMDLDNLPHKFSFLG